MWISIVTILFYFIFCPFGTFKICNYVDEYLLYDAILYAFSQSFLIIWIFILPNSYQDIS